MIKIFSGLHAVFLEDVSTKYRLLFEENGGLVSDTLSTCIEYIFTFHPSYLHSVNSSFFTETDSEMAATVNPDWILDCLQQERLLPRYSGTPSKRHSSMLHSCKRNKMHDVDIEEVELDSVGIEMGDVFDWEMDNPIFSTSIIKP